MKIDFRKIEVEINIDGTTEEVSVCQELGNAIHQHTPDLGEYEFGREIYFNGEVEIDQNRAEIVRKYMDVAQFYARVKVGVNKALDEIINSKQ